MFAAFAALVSCAYYQAFEEKAFLSWMRQTNQFFTGEEYQARFGIFMANSRLVQEHNKVGSFKLSLNKFAAYTPAEYSALLGFKISMKKRVATVSSFKAAAELDWREKGAVVGVKDQGQCGSCWAFSAIASAEGSWFVAGNKLLSFSEQNLVDCVTGCSGCNGGLMDASYDYILASQKGKFNLEDDYKYEAVQLKCRYDASKAQGGISKYLNVVEGSEEDLAAKCSQYGPIAVAIDASNFSFQLYSGGVYDEPSCSPYSLDHGVTCVGYGTEGAKGYWIVKNSWGASWGEQGYIRMLKNGKNQCGIASMACVPVA